MTRYVAGFLFDESKENVVLLLKKKGPSAVVGKWNGVGGKVEPGESALEAMCREFKEEAGVEVTSWTRFLKLYTNHDSLVYFFYAFDSKAILEAHQCEQEDIYRMRLALMNQFKTVPNLSWIIPMALSHKDSNVEFYEVSEAATI